MLLKNFLVKYSHWFILASLAVLAYWQIFFLQNSVQWDMVDCWLPWRYFIGEALQNKMLPLWNPYQQFGYPVHADLQGPSWYPEAILTGAFTAHGIYTLQILFVLYVFLAGAGMYKLSFFFNKSRNASLLAAMAYMLSGFFVAHTQHFFSIISAAWLPFFLFYYLKILSEKSYLNCIKASIILFLMITGGNQTFTIICGYLAATLFIHQFVIFYKERKHKEAYNLFFRNIAFACFTVVLCLPTIISLYQVTPFVQRLEGMSYSEASVNPLSPPSLLSMLIPLATSTETRLFETDLAMRNAYFGVFVLMFLIYAVFRKRTAIENILLVFGTLCLIASMGEHLPVHEFLHRYFPMINRFRFPSYFSYFAITGFIIISCNHISTFGEYDTKKKKLFLTVAGIVIFIILLLAIYSFSQISIDNFSYFKPSANMVEIFKRGTLYENIFFHSVLQLFILGLFFYFFLKTKIAPVKLLLIFIPLEMLFSVQLNIYRTSVGPEKPTEIKNYIQNMPKGFPIPAGEKISMNSDAASSFFPLWRNTNIFSKKFSADGFNSFSFRAYYDLVDYHPRLFEAIIENPHLYLSDKIFSKNILTDSLITRADHLNLYVEDTIFDLYSAKKYSHSKYDTVFITDFSPARLVAKTKTRSEQILTLLQTDYPGWEVKIDNQLVEHFTSNLLFISVIIPAGEHEIIFEYKNNSVVIAFVFSSFFFFIMMLILFLSFLKKYKFSLKQNIFFLLTLITGIILISLAYIAQKPFNEKLSSQIENIVSLVEKYKLQYGTNIAGLINSSEKIAVTGIENENMIFSKLSEPENIADLIAKIDILTSQYFMYIGINSYHLPEVIPVILEKYPHIQDQLHLENADVYLFSKTGEFAITPDFFSMNDFETEYQGWNFPVAESDTVIYFSGNTSNKLDSVNIFSSTFTARFSEIFKNEKNTINISVNAFIPEEAYAELVLSIERDGKSIEYYTSPIHRYVMQQAKWTKVFLARIVKDKFYPSDAVKIYVWNRGQSLLYLDDFKIEVINAEKFDY